MLQWMIKIMPVLIFKICKSNYRKSDFLDIKSYGLDLTNYIGIWLHVTSLLGKKCWVFTFYLLIFLDDLSLNLPLRGVGIENSIII